MQPGVPLVRASLLALALSLVSGAAHATPPRTASLSWARLEGAESCIGSLPLALGVERRLGRSLFVAPAQAQLAVEGHVSRLSGASGWAALIRVADVQGRVLGERELRTVEPSCASLDDPLLVVVSLLLDPDALATASPPAVASPSPAPPPPSARPPAPPEAPGAWSVGATFVLAGGLLPRLTPGMMLRAERWWSSRGLTASVTVLRTAEASRQGRTGELRMQRLDLGLCPLAGVQGRTHLALCAGPGLALWNSQGSDLIVNRDDRALSLLLTVGGQARVKLVGALDLWLGVQVETSLPRIRFSFEQSNGDRPVLFQSPPLAATGALGLAGSWGP